MVPETFGALVSDAAAFNSIVSASLIGSAVTSFLQRMFQKRAEQARELLLEELSQGEKKAWEVSLEDESLAILYRYYTAAINGAARTNLRLMAKVINSMASHQYFNAQDFLSYADLLSSLRRDEIILLANMHQICQSSPNVTYGDLQKQLCEELVPNIFESEELLLAVTGGLVRTGLVQAIPAGFDGVTLYKTSVLMSRLENLASFDEAVNQECQ